MISHLAFKVRAGSALFACNVYSLRSVCGVRPASSTNALAEVGVDSDSNGQSPTQKMNLLPMCQLPG